MTAAEQIAALQRLCTSFPDVFCTDTTAERRRNVKYCVEKVLRFVDTTVWFRAYRLSDKEPRIVKYINLTNEHPAIRAQVQSEVRCIVSCDSVFIAKCRESLVELDDSGREEIKTMALVLDYCAELPLAYVLPAPVEGRHSKESSIIAVFLCALMATYHIHSKSIVHCGLSSHSFFFNPQKDDFLQLGDLSSCQVATNPASNEFGSLFKSRPPYVAPEIWRFSPYTEKSDMYSLGVLLYELLTFKRPFSGDSMRDLVTQILAGTYEPLPPEISPEMASLVGSLLHRNPAMRPTAAAVLRNPLFIFQLATRVSASALIKSSAPEAVLRRKAEEQYVYVSLINETIPRAPAGRVVSNAFRVGSFAYNDDDSALPSVVATRPRPERVSCNSRLHGLVFMRVRQGGWEPFTLHLDRIQGDPTATAASSQLPPIDSANRRASASASSKQSFFLRFYPRLERSLAVERRIALTEVASVFPLPSLYSRERPGLVFAVMLRSAEALEFKVKKVNTCDKWLDILFKYIPLSRAES